MVVQMYVIYDQKAETYNKPFFLVNDQLALRTMRDLVQNPDVDISKYPEDFILFKCGSYDDQGCVFETYPPKVLVKAHELKAIIQNESETDI